jgi:hypothetical protein
VGPTPRVVSRRNTTDPSHPKVVPPRARPRGGSCFAETRPIRANPRSCHLATALGEAAARQGRRVRFATAAGLIKLGRTVRRYGNVDLLILDELAYFPVSQSDAELLF